MRDGKPGNECMEGGRQWANQTRGFCEMEIGRLTGAFENADQRRLAFNAHFCLAEAEAERSVVK